MDHTVALVAGALTGVCTLPSLKHEMRVMLKKRAGSIVNLSSMGSKVGLPGASVYVASKHAVECRMKNAALEGAATGEAKTGVMVFSMTLSLPRSPAGSQEGSSLPISRIWSRQNGWQKRSPGFPFIECARSRAVLTGRRARDIGRP